jgi:hypothetical protein
VSSNIIRPTPGAAAGRGAGINGSAGCRAAILSSLKGLYSLKNLGKISNNSLGIIIGLVISVGWIFMGLDIGFSFEAPDIVSLWLTLGGYRHAIATVLALVLIPACALEKMWAYGASLFLGIITLVLSMLHVWYMVAAMPFGYESQLFGPVIWSAIQLVIIYFSVRATRERRITMEKQKKE